MTSTATMTPAPPASVPEDRLAARISAYAAGVVAQAPPLSQERLDRVVAVIRAGGAR
ncbi:hypothetical protein [Corynebacterium halotolerans]|uniref:hypothetical protein n=1 Tax=Corynebacterium halotolerans TaxID=225326 RepID=UPI000349B16C|nr:hypothetical protein [Corynebacterium halotolerans]